MQRQYLYNKYFELLWIAGPPFISFAAILLFHDYFERVQSLNTWWWVVLILLVDVGHVYSTLYRTYFDKTQRSELNLLLKLIPAICFISAFLLYQFGATAFWRIAAYAAVWHFVRQQYGFVKVYNRQYKHKFYNRVDIITVYAACIYPLVYWHVHGPFQFTWFTANDFVFLRHPILEVMARYLYFAILAVYVISLVMRATEKQMNASMTHLVILGTILSWYAGIVYYNSDLCFSLLNVASHGIPYLAIVWLYGKKQTQKLGDTSAYSKLYKPIGVLIFLAIPVLFGFLEEGLWDAWYWHDQAHLFKMFYGAKVLASKEFLQIAIPALLTPQLTHYVLDGFIWKVSKGHVPEMH
ncbi:MAG: hypothetical protein RL660_730 [Bacteroidota bacterium]